MTKYLALVMAGGFCMGLGIGLMLKLYPWLSTMGRASRKWLTVPRLARKSYHETIASIGDSSGLPGWYVRYIAFRETAFV